MNKTCRRLLFSAGVPLSPIYAAIMRARSAAYASGFLASYRVSRPVICLGNISMGGTGKTPHVIWLCKKLAETGLRPAVISRGYGGRAGKGPLVVSEGAGPNVTPHIAGDEPVMIARRLKGVPVVIGSDRVASARLAISRLGAEIIVLDDGFQHLRLKRDLDIVLIPATRPLKDEKVFPGGELREPPQALSRASCVLITRAEGISPLTRKNFVSELKPYLGGKPVFFSRNKVSGILPFGEKGKRKNTSNHMHFAFCGLGDPDSFLTTLQAEGIKTAGHRWFPDHHKYDSHDLLRLVTEAQKAGADALVTTAKDAVKLSSLDTEHIPMQILVVEIEPSVDKKFWDLVYNSLKNKRRHGGRGGGI